MEMQLLCHCGKTGVTIAYRSVVCLTVESTLMMNTKPKGPFLNLLTQRMNYQLKLISG